MKKLLKKLFKKKQYGTVPASKAGTSSSTKKVINPDAIQMEETHQ